MSKNILLTGANGFLGSKVHDNFCSKGFNVINIDNITKFSGLKEWELYFTDIINVYNPVAIINVGSSQRVGDGFDEINDLTTSNVICPSMIAAYITNVNIECQFITISTSWQYGPNGEYSPFNLYAASKQALDDYLQHYAMRGLIVSSLILFDTFSADDKRRKLHRLIADALHSKTKLDMTKGEQCISLVHVEDAAEAIYQTYLNRKNQKSNPYTVMKWSIMNKNILRVKDMLDVLNESQKDLFVLGGRPYRNREIFSIWNGFINVPGWHSKVSVVSELKKLFHVT